MRKAFFLPFVGVALTCRHRRWPGCGPCRRGCRIDRCDRHGCRRGEFRWVRRAEGRRIRSLRRGRPRWFGRRQRQRCEMLVGERLGYLLGLRRTAKIARQPHGRRARAIARFLREHFGVEPLQCEDRAWDLRVARIFFLPIPNRALRELRGRECRFRQIVVDVISQAGISQRVADPDETQFKRPKILITRRE